MSDLRTHLADHIAALIDPYENAETYTLRSAVPDSRPAQEIRVHRVRFPPLLTQLATAIEPSSSVEQGARGYESSPAARLDAIDRLLAIEVGAAKWLADLGQPLRHDTAANLRALVGLDLADDQMRLLADDARRWLTWARVVTGWDKPPLRPKGPCMHCGTQGSIRVRVSDHPFTACCVECGSTWHEDDGTLGLLGEHVRAFNGETVA